MVQHGALLASVLQEEAMSIVVHGHIVEDMHSMRAMDSHAAREGVVNGIVLNDGARMGVGGSASESTGTWHFFFICYLLLVLVRSIRVVTHVEVNWVPPHVSRLSHVEQLNSFNVVVLESAEGNGVTTEIVKVENITHVDDIIITMGLKFR